MMQHTILIKNKFAEEINTTIQEARRILLVNEHEVSYAIPDLDFNDENGVERYLPAKSVFDAAWRYQGSDHALTLVKYYRDFKRTTSLFAVIIELDDGATAVQLQIALA